MSSKKAVVEDFNSCPSWFETVKYVSALAMPPDLGLRVRTSCSAGQSAELDFFALSFTHTDAGTYYCKWSIEGGVFS